MVCKEDVVTWFKELTSHKRIDVMCTLLNMCLPFELRFLGTCLEDLGKRDFHEFRDVENRANNVSELSDLQCISDKRTQRKLALYLALLHSCNHACSNGLFKILTDFDFGEINNITNNTSDENPLDELLLLYTLALNHPAFTYEQRAEFGNILVKLQEEESKLYAARHSVGIGLVYVKNPIQACIPCPTSDEQGQLGPCTGITIPHTHLGEGKLRSPCPCPCPLPPPAAPAPALPPPGLVPAPGAGPEPLTFLHLAYPSPAAAAQGVGVPWGAHAHHAPTGLMMPVAAPAATLVTSGGEEQSGAGGASASPASPLTSRQASPQQSASPSRAASPAERPAHHYAFKSSSGQRRDLPLDGLQATRDREREREGLRDALGKELPSFAHSLQHYSAEELKRMGDEDLRELGLPPSAVMQLRSLVGKLQGTNGLTSLAPHSRPKPPRPEEQHSATEVDRRRPLLAAGPCFACFVPAPSAAPAPAPAPAARFLPSPAAPCGPAVCCASHGLRALRLDERPAPAAALSAAPAALGALGVRGTSSSDSSAGPSPPDTPHAPAAALPLAHWHHGDLHDKEKGTEDCSRETTTAAASSGSGACAPATSTAAAPASCAASYAHSSSSSSSSSCSSGGSSSGSTCSLSGGCGGGGGAGSGRGGGRPPGLARGKAAGGPPGVQTVARGRGPAPGAAPGAAAVAPANERPGARRPPASISASTAATADPSGAAPPQLNGAPPPRLPPPPPQSQQQQDDRTKVFLVSGEAFGGGAPLPFAPAPSAPASPAPFGPLHAPHFAPHHPHPHPHHLRSSSLFPSFAAATYMRPFSFASPNGELVYGFHPAGPPPPPPPQTPPPPPPQQAAGSAPASASAPVSAPGAPQAAQTPPTTAPAAGTGFVAAFAPQVPPPKLSCYNCGSHQHHGADCKDPTMEDMTKPGQYRLDFSPYAKGPGGGGNAPGGGELPSADK